MKIEPYRSDELSFAYCCHVYYRWQSYCRKPNRYLAQIDAARIEAERPGIHILDIEANDIELALLASLQPTDSVATGASKIKGGASKILKQLASLTRVPARLSVGYFACTTGPRTTDQLDRYLENQGQHHGYGNRRNAPWYVRTWPATDDDDAELQAKHSRTVVRWHLVFSTWNRKSAFSMKAAEAVTDVWERRFDRRRIQLRKVSFVPDHVHLAIAAHPSIVPADVVLELLNSSPELMFESIDRLLIAAGNRRIWRASAYVGTYGDLSSRQVQAYLRNWPRATT